MAGWLDELFNPQAPAELRGLLGNFGMYNAPGPSRREDMQQAEEMRQAEEARAAAAARMARQMRPDRSGFTAGFPPAPDLYGATSAFGMPQFATDPNAAPPLPAPTDVGPSAQPPLDQPTPVQTVQGTVADRPIGGIPPDAQGAVGPTGAVAPAGAMAPPSGAAPFFPGQDVLARVGRHILQTLHDNSNSMIAGGGAMISGGLGHGLSAMAAAAPIDIAARKERQGNAAIQATYDAVLRQQLSRGVPMADAQATALGASQNAELLKTVVGPQYQHVEIKGIGGDTQIGAFDPRTGKVTVNGQPAGTAGVSGPDMPSGQEYLDKYVPKNVHAFIKAAANYDVPISGMGTLKQLQPHILNYDPSYDAANYASKVALKKNYLGGGKNYEELKSFERLGNHLNTLREAVQDLDPSRIVGMNSLRNLFSDYGVNDPKVITLRNALNTVNHELGNAYHAGHITDSTLHAFQQNLNDTMSVPGFKAGIGTMGELVHGIIKSNENAFNAALPGEKGPKEFKALSEETRQKFQTINEWAHGVGRGAAAAPAPPAAPAAPKKGDTVKGTMGGKPVTVEFDGTNWVPK